MPAPPRARILVADDHADVRHAISTILRSDFDLVAEVGDGLAAVEAAQTLRPDVVVLDIAMPRLDGFGAATRIASRTPAPRIVFLSNYAGPDYVLASVARGASAFVAKADVARDLRTAIRHALEGRMFVPSVSILPQWTRPEPRHDLLLYDTEEFCLSAMVDLLQVVLDAGQSVVAIAGDAQRRALDGIFGDHASTGRYVSVASTEALEAIMRNGMPDAELYAMQLDPLVKRGLAAAVDPEPHVTIAGAIAPILLARGEFDAMIRLEQIADAYAATRPSVSILCCYSASKIARHPADVLAHVCANHAVVVPGR